VRVARPLQSLAAVSQFALHLDGVYLPPQAAAPALYYVDTTLHGARARDRAFGGCACFPLDECCGRMPRLVVGWASGMGVL
jgi:hypothetical protein